MNSSKDTIALLGVGSIGVSFAALYLRHTGAVVKVYDPRPDLTQHLRNILPAYLDPNSTGLHVEEFIENGRLKVCESLKDACCDASIVQEQGPENLQFKTTTWAEVISVVSPKTHLWSSTSGITASRQIEQLSDKTRLLVVHPFNPPHIMPLIEIVPSASTNPEEVQFAKDFFQNLDSKHQAVVVKKEVPGFVGNRLAFVLLREACYLVEQGVVDVADLDKIVECSIGPRWATTGPFKAYNYGGGAGGLAAFMHNLGGTIQEIWDDAGQVSFRDKISDTGNGSESAKQSSNTKDWADMVIEQTEKAYGMPTTSQLIQRDTDLRAVIDKRKPAK